MHSAGRGHGALHPSRRLTPLLFVLPLLALLAFVFGYPLVRIFEFSFKMVRGVDGPWIGVRNYELVLGHPLFWESVTHNLMLLAAIPVMVILALVISIVLYERVQGWKLYRVILFLPYILAVPIIAVVLKKMFQFSGPVNEILRWLSLDFMALDWIGSSDVALWTVILVIVWRESALGIILFLARLLSLDESLIEAARIEGANWWQRVWYVILPQMKGRDRILRRRQRHHHAGGGLRLHLHDQRRARRAGHLHLGPRALHLQRADPHQPAGHRVGGRRHAVRGLDPAHLPAVRGTPEGT